MSAQKHTPGPWSAEWAEESVGYHINGPERDGGWREIIAQTVSGNAIANANLIAAAPELLKACQAGLNWLERLKELGANISIGEGGDEQPTLEELRAAIAKAQELDQSS